MRVAVVGPGALGRVVAAALRAGGETPTLVGRPDGPAGVERVAVARAGRRARGACLWEPAVDLPIAVRAPADSDVAIVCVRVEHVVEAAEAAADATGAAPVVTLAPLFLRDLGRLRGRLGDRLVAGQPGIVADARSAGVVRFWTPVATRIDARGGGPSANDVVAALRRAGVPARRDERVAESNMAITAAFLPLVLAVDAAGGSVAAVVADRARLGQAIAATGEARRIAASLGELPPWADRLLGFVGPLSLRLAARAARAASPDAVPYVESHFGRRMHVQSVRLGRELVEIGKARGLPVGAIEDLVEAAARGGG